MELLEANGALEDLILHRLGVADEIVTHGDPKILLAKYGLDADGIYVRAKDAMTEQGRERPKPQRLKAVK